MANYANLLATIAANIYTNNNNEVTAAGVQAAVNAMVASLGAGYQFMGVAHPADTPSGYADLRAFWLAGEAGTYTDFGGLVLADGEVALLKYNGSWSKEVTNIATADSLANSNRPFLFAPSKFLTAYTNQSYVSVSPFYYNEHIQKNLRGLEIWGIDVYIATPGDFSVVIAKNVGDASYSYQIFETFSTLEIGRKKLRFSQPLVLESDEWIGFGHPDDTASFGYIENETFGGDYCFYYSSEELRYKNDSDLQIGIIAIDLTETPAISSGNSELAIKDDMGHAIVVFRDGHIKTKNFDSKDLSGLFLTKFAGKKIGIIGDSISTYAGWLPSDIQGYDGQTYATYYPAGNVNSVEKTWWYKMAVALGLDPATDISNCAWSGSRVSGNSESTTNAYAGCSDRRISDLLLRGFTPDIIICYISCNDWGNSPNVPVGTWAVTDPIPAEGNKTTLRDAYALMINKLHIAYPNARVFCCTNLDDVARDQTPGWPSNNSLGVSTYEWNQNIIEVAHALGCDIIDLNHCGINYANIAQFAVDAGLHPNEAGHTMMARKVVSELYAKY